MWQQLHDELAPFGFEIIAIALDTDAEAVREWARPADGTRYSFPIVIDREHRSAEAYGFTNVPATVWVDEAGIIVRPADRAMGDDRFRAFTGVDSSVHHDELRAWVREGTLKLDTDGVRAFTDAPSEATQLARLHRRVGLELFDRGDQEGAGEHFAASEALAPDDWTIRRGNMPMTGRDPFGPAFFEFMTEWNERGRPGEYRLMTGVSDS